MKVYRKHIGRSVMVQFNEGKMEGILVDIENTDRSPSNFLCPNAKVFFLLDRTLLTVEFDQILDVGKMIEIKS